MPPPVPIQAIVYATKPPKYAIDTVQTASPKVRLPPSKSAAYRPLKAAAPVPAIRPIGQDAPQNAAMPNSFRWIAKCFMVMDNLNNWFRKRTRSVWKDKFP